MLENLSLRGIRLKLDYTDRWDKEERVLGFAMARAQINVLSLGHGWSSRQRRLLCTYFGVETSTTPESEVSIHSAFTEDSIAHASIRLAELMLTELGHAAVFRLVQELRGPIAA